MDKYLTFQNDKEKIEIYRHLDQDEEENGYFLSLAPRNDIGGDNERSIYFSAEEMLDVLDAFTTFVRDLEDMAIPDEEEAQSYGIVSVS